MKEKMSIRDKITLTVFLFVTFTSGLMGYLLDQILTEQPEGDSLGMGLWLVLPLLTGIVLRIINKDLKQIGARPHFKNNMKWYAVAALVFPGIMLVCIIVAKLTGALIVKATAFDTLFALVLTTFLVNCVRNIFEEFAWRGCLVPFLEKTRMNDWFLYLVSGFVWGMWHFTYYMFFLPDTYFTEYSRPLLAIAGVILMILWSPLFVELRRLTNSVWPGVIMHATEDSVPTLLFVTTEVFRLKNGFSSILDPIYGVLPTLLLFLVGLELRRCRIRRERVHSKC